MVFCDNNSGRVKSIHPGVCMYNLLSSPAYTIQTCKGTNSRVGQGFEPRYILPFFGLAWGFLFGETVKFRLDTMELHGIFHGKFAAASEENSTELDVDSPPCTMGIHGIPWSFMEFHSFPWNSRTPWHTVVSTVDLHGNPWYSTEFHGFDK